MSIVNNSDIMQLFNLAEMSRYEEIRGGCWTREELDARGANGRTALMNAAIRNDYRVIEALKQKGADIDLLDNDGRKAVHLAAQRGNAVAIAYLIEGGCGG